MILGLLWALISESQIKQSFIKVKGCTHVDDTNNIIVPKVPDDILHSPLKLEDIVLSNDPPNLQTAEGRKQELLKWCKERTATYKEVQIVNFQSFVDGKGTSSPIVY